MSQTREKQNNQILFSCSSSWYWLSLPHLCSTSDTPKKKTIWFDQLLVLRTIMTNNDNNNDMLTPEDERKWKKKYDSSFFLQPVYLSFFISQTIYNVNRFSFSHALSKKAYLHGSIKTCTFLYLSVSCHFCKTRHKGNMTTFLWWLLASAESPQTFCRWCGC